MTVQQDLREEIWETLLEAMDKCQAAIELLEKLDGGSNQYLAEWEELDGAFAHMHNVKRWIGRAWRSQEAKARAAPQPIQTMVLTKEQMEKALEEMKKAQR